MARVCCALCDRPPLLTQAIVIAHEAGKGKNVGKVGALLCRLRSGKTFKVGTGFSAEEREHDAAPRIGAVISYRYFELTKDNVPRFVRAGRELHLPGEALCHHPPPGRALTLPPTLVQPSFLRVRPDVSADVFR